MSSVPQPTQIGRYAIVRPLDQGASGLVYEGWDPDRCRPVAIKTIAPSRLQEPDGHRLLARMYDEAQLFGTLAHPNIAALYEYGEAQNVPFIALELLSGKTLKEHLEAGDRFAPARIVDIFCQILDALAYMHDMGVVHLDLKPANIVLSADHRVKLTDFGISRLEAHPTDRYDAIMGTPGYMSPEQVMGQRLDRRSDLFSVGAILYELLTGVRPFPGRQFSTVMQRVLNLSPAPPSRHNAQLPPGLDAVVQQALAKQPADRFQDAPSFRLAIQQAFTNTAEVLTP